MLQELRTWLNGKRDYTAGVQLYARLGDNKALLGVFRDGQTPYTTNRLQKELEAICSALKQQQYQPAVIGQHPPTKQAAPAPAPPIPAQYTQLYDQAKILADNTYKEAMNKRAVLFTLAQYESYENPNTAELIKQRAPMALAVVTLYNRASMLYARADYVLHHGRYPEQDAATGGDDYEHLPDHLVKKALDNLRKNVNKMKQREQTPERLALLAKHCESIKKLEEKWRLLQAKG